MSEHAVIVYLNLSDDKLGTEAECKSIHKLSNRLDEQINAQGVGEFDGNEFGQGRCKLFMYGPNADDLYSAIEPILRESALSTGGHIIMRYGEAGDPDAKEVRVDL